MRNPFKRNKTQPTAGMDRAQIGGDYTVIEASNKPMNNKQRLKDREVQRAFDSGYELAALPTRSRRRRAGVTVKDLLERTQKEIEKIRNERMSVQNS